MREIPECLTRRYNALDELIKDLNSYQPSHDAHEVPAPTDDPGIKLMCDFWDILKEDPGINLSQAVKQRMGITEVGSSSFGKKKVSCYRCCDDKKSQESQDNRSGNSLKPLMTSAGASQDNMPLNKVLCNLKEAASFEKKCQDKIEKLSEAQSELQDQIRVLETKENESVKLLKEADYLWSSMEETYKKKIAESLERQNCLLKQLKEVETSNGKWRKNKKDLDFQLKSINKCYQEIKEKIAEKTSDIKCIDLEIENFKKHIECNHKDLEAANKSFSSKKQASDAKMNSIANELAKVETSFEAQKKHKYLKEQEGTKFIKEAREELQKLCKVLLQKKLEGEDLQAEKEALLLEMGLLVQACDQCKDKCKNKQESVEEEIKAIQKEIADFKVKCIQCHECLDTSDIRKLCTDCPRCIEERNCLIEGDHCAFDHSIDCVCMTVKQKFLDNVFDNMYTSLERQIQSKSGKAVAEEVVNCLKKSRNGKLNEPTRKILQDFILTTVKKNLNLTIVGGAVKTRCEMDKETYDQLMLCLKRVKVTKPKKTDKGTEAKKEPCKRWGPSSECNCPKGPKACICTKKAPIPVAGPTPCPQQPDEDAGEDVICPHKDSTPCGPDCGMQGVANAVGSEVAAWRPSPCQGQTCQFTNMRAAQCVLGPEILPSAGTPFAKSFFPSTSVLEEQVPCKCSDQHKLPRDCPKDDRGHPRERIIEEVMGRYTEVTPIEKVTAMINEVMGNSSSQRKSDGCSIIYTKRAKTSIETLLKSSQSSCGLYSKQMKVDNTKTCNKTYASVQESVLQNRNNENIDKINVNYIPVRKTVRNSNKNQSKKNVLDDSIKLDDVPPVITKTFSGVLKVALAEKYVQLIDKKSRDHSNIFQLNNTGSDELLIDSQTEGDISQNNNNVLVKRTPSGNIVLEFDQNVPKKCLPNFLKQINNVEKKNDKMSKSNNIPHENVYKNMISEKRAESNIQSERINRLLQVRVKSIYNKYEKVFALRQIDSEAYELILDKEFEKWYLRTIKDYHSEKEDEYTCFARTDSGNFIMNIDVNAQNNSESQKALLLKSDSGNIKFIVSKSDSKSEIIRKCKGSVISTRTLSQLLNKPPNSSREFNRNNLKKSPIIAKKSSSDSNVYGKVKFDMQYNENLIASEAVLKKTNSGQYTVVLDKRSKNAFINHLKKALSSSSSGLIPLKRTDSGSITVGLNRDFRNKYGLLKITQSGNLYVVLENKNIGKGKLTNAQTSTESIIRKESQFPLNINIMEVGISKATTTTCHGQYEANSCEENKCICEDKDTKEFFNENPEEIFCNENNSGINHRCNEHYGNDLNSKDDDIQNKLHIVIKPREYHTVLENSMDENYNVVQSTCPYHIGRYTALSNEILEISSLCQKTHNERLYDDYDENKDVEKRTAINYKRKIATWDSVELLPPQLPSFLKDY